jgi:hypothetical protein
VRRRRATRQNAGSVGHADWIRDITTIENHASVGDRIEMRSSHDTISPEADMIGALLIGDDEENVRAILHGASQATNSGFSMRPAIQRRPGFRSIQN